MSSNVKKEFLDLGRHPIANAFLQKEEDFKDSDVEISYEGTIGLASEIKTMLEGEISRLESAEKSIGQQSGDEQTSSSE